MELSYIWQWHLDTCSPQPITYLEWCVRMNAWASLKGLQLQGLEIDMLWSLDRVYRKVINEQ